MFGIFMDVSFRMSIIFVIFAIAISMVSMGFPLLLTPAPGEGMLMPTS